MCAIASVGGTTQLAPSGTRVTVGCFVIDHFGTVSGARRLCSCRPNGQRVGSSTSCVAQSVRNCSTCCCTTSRNFSVGSAWTSTGVRASAVSASTLTPADAEIAVSTVTEYLPGVNTSR